MEILENWDFSIDEKRRSLKQIVEKFLLSALTTFVFIFFKQQKVPDF